MRGRNRTASAHAAFTVRTCSATMTTGGVAATRRRTRFRPASDGSASCGVPTACCTTVCRTLRAITPTRALATPATSVSASAGQRWWVCHCWHPVCAATHHSGRATAAAWPVTAAAVSTKLWAELATALPPSLMMD